MSGSRCSDSLSFESLPTPIKFPMRYTLLSAVFLLCLASPLWAQRNLKDVPPPDPALEQKTFILPEGFEVNLYAADPMLAKPIQMSFDAQGRLWVAASEVYPQIKPGQAASDKILVLDDTNNDGVVDKTTVFADGLLIPTGVLPGDGGVYVANSTELLHFRDTDGDGKADRSRIVLSGFGTEDTHHILHTLRWGIDGMMYMNQSIYIHSHIETPYGVRRLDGGGIWQFRPETLRLEIFAKGHVNTWGHHQDYWGQSFATDGAYGEGINYTFPGGVFCTSPGAKRILKGLNPGSPKHCGLEILSGRHLPPDWTGSMITNDFRANRVCRFTVTDQEGTSGYTSRQQTELIKSSHIAFRPVDVRMGPDGAIYIADWYNPIIQHGEVDFRDPRRDKVHGRIWRVTAKGRPLVQKPKIVGAPIADLLEMLRAPEDFTRLHARLELKARGAAEVLPALADWVGKLDPKDAAYEHLRLEALWTYQALDAIDQPLLESLLAAKDFHARAAAMRVLAHYVDRVPTALSWIEKGVHDAAPRVRLEAVRAAARIPTSQAAEIAIQAANYPLDEWLDFALWQAMRDLEPAWLPKVKSGELNFGGKVEYLTFALKAVEQPGVVAPLVQLLKDGKVSRDRLDGVLTLIGTLGGPAEMGAVFDIAISEKSQLEAAERAGLMKSLVVASAARKLKPAGQLDRIGTWLQSKDSNLVVAGARAAGAWGLAQFREELKKFAAERATGSEAVSQAGVDALVDLGGPESIAALKALADAAENPPINQERQLIGLTKLDTSAAVERAVVLLGKAGDDYDPALLIAALIERRSGPEALTKALAEKQIKTDLAKRAIRAANNSLRPVPDLIAAIRSAGKLTENAKLSPQEQQAILAAVATQGDPARGEAIFRRADLACYRCHAIGGAGGRVGPDLVSVGASAPVDYLLDSLLEPNKKLKEGFSSIVIETKDGRLVTGIPVRETKTEIVLRDGNDKEVTIAPDNVADRGDGRSLMPDGATDTLTRAELIDLVRFLSELGKVGPYAVSKARLVRRWQTPTWTQEAHQKLNRTSHDSAASDDPAFTWEGAYSRVGGELPIDGLPKFTPHADLPPVSFVRFQLDSAVAGKIAIRLGNTAGLTGWVNGRPTTLASDWSIDIPAGRSTITLAIDRAKRTEPLKAELVETPGKTVAAEIVSGK